MPLEQAYFENAMKYLKFTLSWGDKMLNRFILRLSINNKVVKNSKLNVIFMIFFKQNLFLFSNYHVPLYLFIKFIFGREMN